MASCALYPDWEPDQILASKPWPLTLGGRGGRRGENAVHHPLGPAHGGRAVPGDGSACFPHPGGLQRGFGVQTAAHYQGHFPQEQDLCQWARILQAGEGNSGHTHTYYY